MIKKTKIKSQKLKIIEFILNYISFIGVKNLI